MNNKEFIAALSEKTGMSPKQTQSLVDKVTAAMGDHFLEGDTLRVVNFGNFELKKKMERVMVNPTTGQRMLVPPKLVLTFKPSTGLKEVVRRAAGNNDGKGGDQ